MVHVTTLHKWNKTCMENNTDCKLLSHIKRERLLEVVLWSSICVSFATSSGELKIVIMITCYLWAKEWEADDITLSNQEDIDQWRVASGNRAWTSEAGKRQQQEMEAVMQADRQRDSESVRRAAGRAAVPDDSEEAREPLTVSGDHVRNIITTNSAAAVAAAVCSDWLADHQQSRILSTLSACGRCGHVYCASALCAGQTRERRGQQACIPTSCIITLSVLQCRPVDWWRWRNCRLYLYYNYTTFSSLSSL